MKFDPLIAKDIPKTIGYEFILNFQYGSHDSHFFNPQAPVEGKFHYPTARLFSASLKMKIKIPFLLEIVRNYAKKHKMQLFPFCFHLTWTGSHLKIGSAQGREGGERWQNEGLEALKWLFMNEYGSVSFCHTLVTYFQWLRHYCRVSAQMKGGKWYCAYKPHPAVNLRGFINPIRHLGVKMATGNNSLFIWDGYNLILRTWLLKIYLLYPCEFPFA